MPESPEEPEVTEWKTWRKKVDDALAALGPKSKAPEEEEGTAERKAEPEAVEPPKAEVKPPKSEAEKPEPPKRSGLHKLIFG